MLASISKKTSIRENTRSKRFAKEENAIKSRIWGLVGAVNALLKRDKLGTKHERR